MKNVSESCNSSAFCDIPKLPCVTPDHERDEFKLISNQLILNVPDSPLKVCDDISGSYLKNFEVDENLLTTGNTSPSSTLTGETTVSASSDSWPWSSTLLVKASRRDKCLPVRDMPMDFWVRSEECKLLKTRHLDYIDKHYYSREQFIEDTVFCDPMTGIESDIVLEPNMFPYQTPLDVEHWTLWSRKDLTHEQVESWVNNWIIMNKPHVHHWNYDDNAGDRSILWFHVHVYLQYDDVRFTRPRLTGKDVDQEADERSHLKRSRRSRSRAVSPDPLRRRKRISVRNNFDPRRVCE